MAKGFKVTIENGAYRVKFPYSPQAVEALKRYVPASGRSWDNTRKCWLIAASEKKNAETALAMSFPEIVGKAPVAEMRMLTVHYVGQCKERAPGDISAMGMDDKGNWTVFFPMATLIAWFDGSTQATTGALSLYSVLGAHPGDNAEALKSAYRRMAKQWHPDVCREPDANTRFLRIREAWDILSNSNMRARYDAGLALEATLEKHPQAQPEIYRAPLRCGYIMAEGTPVLARFVVSKIMAWEDIVNSAGQSLVVSWKMGDKEPTKVWA
jgi:hypothetical protein